MVSVPRVLSRRPRTGDVVARPRLVDGPAGQITVITGPAGTGKSVLAGQLADAHGGRIAWIRLAPGWSSPSLLPVMVAAALGETAEASDDPNVVADTILGHLEEAPTCLVVDDLHEAEGDVESVLAEIVGFLPDDAAVIVTTRRRPAVLIGRSAGEVVRIVDGDALRFDETEVGALLADRQAAGADDAAAALDATDGWASLVAAWADQPGDTSTANSVLATSMSATALGEGWPVARVLAVVPYAGQRLLADLGHDAGALAALAESTSLVSEVDGRWLLHGTAREHVAATMSVEEVDEIRRRSAHVLADEDAPTAVELLIAAGEHDAAGDVLASRASEIGPDRATRWLYQLPAEVRRRLPPLLTSGRATVNVSLALEAARQQVEAADDPRTLREGLAGLGSLLLADGELAEAAENLEAALRLADDDADFRAVVGDHLATTRWLAGDDVGTLGLLDALPPSVWSAYRRAVIALDRSDPDSARTAADEAAAQAAAGNDATTAPVLASRALAAIASGDRAAAATHAASAYAAAVDVAGRDLAVAGPIHAWALLAAGDLDGAEAVADQLDRTIARHDKAARLHSAHLRLAVVTARGDDDGGRAARRVADLRSLGFAPAERLISVLRGGDGDPQAAGLRITLCGAFEIAVDGQPLAPSAWKSKKARDVCVILCHAGPSGLRREQVIEAVWEGRDPQKGRTLLRTALTEIRRVLEPRRGTGQESRFVATADDRVIVLGTTDLNDADRHRSDDPVSAFRLVMAGLASDGPDGDWFFELGAEIDRVRTELAARVAPDDVADPAVRVAAFEALIEAEPWQRSHFAELAELHRSLGDEHAAADVDRRWFADD